MLPQARLTLPPIGRHRLADGDALFCRAGTRSEAPILTNIWVSFLIKEGNSLFIVNMLALVAF